MEHARPARGNAQKKTRHASERERPDVAAARAAWRQRQPGLNPTRLVFIDETWATTNMARTRGRCPRGQRLHAAVPHGHWKTSTVVAALRNDGITAPFVIDCAINGSIFRTYVKKVLAPPLDKGDIVIIANLGSHKGAGVREAIEVRGATLLYLPAYSPDLNPIEPVFAKLKELLRAIAARTVTDLWSAIGRLLDHFSPQECANYLANCGYGQSA